MIHGFTVDSVPALIRRNLGADCRSATIIEAFSPSAEDVPAVKGAYVIAIRLAKPLTVRIVGRRVGILSPGRYLYCGSANGPGGLKARLRRHMRRGKTIRWHVDQLTENGTVERAWILPDGNECALVASLSDLPMPMPRFGSSDCRQCRSHLLAWPHGR